jgi:hypothetical protein
MTSLETLHTKNAVNELNFLLVTHTTYFNIRFGSYGFLKSGYAAELFCTDWTLERNPSFRGAKWVKLGEASIRILQLVCSAFRRLLIHTISITTVMVMATQRQRSWGVNALPKNCLFNGLRLRNSFGTWRGLRFLRLPYCLVD